MKVKKLIELLAQCDPEAEIVVNAPYQGMQLATVVHRRMEHGGIGLRYSFEPTSTVEISNGNLDYMRSQGCDVIG